MLIPQAIVQTGGGSSINYGTTLPGSPSDGDLAILVDSTSAPTYQWLLRYVSAKSSNKWIYLGGTDARSYIVTDESTTTTGSWVDLTTTGPSVTIPVTGDYVITGQCSFYQVGGGGNPMYMGLWLDTSSALFAAQHASTDTWTQMTAFVYSSRTAADEMRMRYYLNGGPEGHWQARTILVRPIAIGG